MAEMLGFCPVISRSGPEKPLYGTKNRSQSPWNRPIWGAAREFDFRDEFAADSPLQRRVCLCTAFNGDRRGGRRFRGARGVPRRREKGQIRLEAALLCSLSLTAIDAVPPPNNPTIRWRGQEWLLRVA